ncbi:MAG: EamA family transporter, partial [candidate division Zixibacteria bacterium]|nr:DMT family transporter [candidate division KSB1 bacterium]NIR63138.1 DMT family transporter [candidate division Zixibacteria bacterium]NIS45123.1 DMT family transporter [candidate division Zixibacteria bacterium]NIT69422.1 DMT family transporter [candidate division KSB1 bacterium]NIU13283.1 DMT family transporter [candidate division Zixibacteria bacterium]
MSNTRISNLVVLFFMTIFFGLTFIATKFALQGIGVFQLVFARYALALSVLTALFWRSRHRFRIQRQDWKFFIVMTMIEPVGYFILETFGIRYTSPGSASLIIATIPIFSMIFATLLLKEKPGLLAVVGMLVCFLGVYFIVNLQKTSSLAPSPLLGNVLVLGAATCAGLYNCYARRLTRNYAPLTLTF